MVNMVAIRQLTDDSPDPTESLHNILNESPDESSEGSTKTASSFPTFPQGFGGMIFHISVDSGTKNGETPKEREARLAKNADRQCRCDDEAAQNENNQDENSPPCPRRNLQEEFDMVRDQLVHQTPSTNLAVAFNELEKLSQSPEVEKIRAHIMVAQVQVNEIRNPLPSHSSTLVHNHRSHRDGGGQHRDNECPQH
jgi:hypothetical protein